MNGVLGMSELLLGTSLSAKQRDYVQTIHSSGNELLNLINEILDISRLESGQIELDDVQFDLNALIEDRSEEHTSELQSLMRISYAVFCLKKKTAPQEPCHVPVKKHVTRHTLTLISSCVHHILKQTTQFILKTT